MADNLMENWSDTKSPTDGLTGTKVMETCLKTQRRIPEAASRVPIKQVTLQL